MDRRTVLARLGALGLVARLPESIAADEASPTFTCGCCVAATGGKNVARISHLRWDVREPIPVYARLDQQWRRAMKQAVRRWRRAFPLLRLQLNFVSTRSNLGRGIYVAHRAGGKNQPAGAAQPTVRRQDRPFLYQVHIMLNDAELEQWEKRDRRFVELVKASLVTHELGHALGIWHHTPGASTDVMEASGGLGLPTSWSKRYLRRQYRMRQGQPRHR